MPSIAEPSRCRLDVLLFMDMDDLNTTMDEHPDLADLRVYSESRYMEGAKIRNAYMSRRAFLHHNYKGGHLFWRTLDACQHAAGLNGKIIIL